jgi:hypothetical protein
MIVSLPCIFWLAHTAKKLFAVFYSLWHTVKIQVLGKAMFSRSGDRRMKPPERAARFSLPLPVYEIQID